MICHPIVWIKLFIWITLCFHRNVTQHSSLIYRICLYSFEVLLFARRKKSNITQLLSIAFNNIYKLNFHGDNKQPETTFDAFHSLPLLLIWGTKQEQVPLNSFHISNETFSQKEVRLKNGSAFQRNHIPIPSNNDERNFTLTSANNNQVCVRRLLSVFKLRMIFILYA